MYNLINEMLMNCVHLGHKSNSMNKMMKKYIINENNDISIINLEKSAMNFAKVLNIIKNLTFQKKTILIVYTKKYNKKLIKIGAKSVNIPYSNKRWLGGNLTNFESLKNSVKMSKYIRNLLLNKKVIKLKKRYFYIYTKKIKKINKFIEGIKRLKKTPDFIFTIDSIKHKKIILESKRMKIPIACVVDTNSSPENIDFVIPGNDDSFKSVLFFLKKIIDTIINSRKILLKKKEYIKYIKSEELRNNLLKI